MLEYPNDAYQIDSEILFQVLNHLVPEHSLLGTARMNCVVHCDDGNTLVANSLWDTGAERASYVGSKFLSSFRSRLKEYKFKELKSQVMLADSVTKLDVNEAVYLNLSFVSNSGKVCHISERFYVIASNEDLIIGLPCIVSKLLPLFMEMLHNIDPIPLCNILIENPWSEHDVIADEDANTLSPCAFPDALHYLSISHDEAVKEYFSLIDAHVSEDFRKSTPIVDLLKTKGVDVFVPKSWEGIKDIEIELKWKDGLPDRLKPPARPINPKLYENAKKEFERLLGYFYEPSDSPIASPLVVAYKRLLHFYVFAGIMLP